MHGSKAKNLEILQSLHLKVPEFYEIKYSLLKNLNNPEVANKLSDAFLAWCKRNSCDVVAVRSSAEDEDSTNQSFAGQYKSIMQVKGSASFLKALQTVVKSKPSEAYAKATKDLKVNVVVQRYIDPNIAGVLFTVNPSNGFSEMLINAAIGHGSKVVDGEDVSAVHIDRISNDIRSQQKQLVLSVNKIRQLQKLGEKIEGHMRTPQDIEWAFADDVLYVLQTRPITRIAHLRVWDNANVGESFPGIILPLTFSISRRGYELVYKSQSYEAGLDWYQIEANHRTYNAMVGLFAGRVYYNLANWYKFIGLFPNNSQNQKYLDEQLQTVGNAVYLPPSRYPLSYKLSFWFRVMRRTIFFNREKKNYWKYMDNSFKQYERLPMGNDLFLLLERYSFIEQTIIPHMGRGADNDFFVLIFHGLLRARFRKWFGEENSQSTDFLGSLHEVISARQALLLSEIADFISSDQKASQLLKNDNFEELDDYIVGTKASGLINEYRTKFLHRFAEDQKIESTNPLLSLPGFYGLIKAYQQLNKESVNGRRLRAIKNETERSNKIKLQLGIFQKPTYEFLLWRLKHHLRIREHNRLLRGKAYALLRELFIHVGAYLLSEDLVEKSTDINYLDIEELFQLVNGTGYQGDLKQLIKSRKSSYVEYEKLNVPSRFITTSLTNKLPNDFLETKYYSDSKTSKSIKGTISSPGNVEGRVIVLDKPIIPKEPFDILVVSHTDPGWTPLIALAKGLIIEHGGILSHAAIVTRELGIPSIIGVEDATRRLKTGMRVRINSTRGTVEII
jgi:phosphohistidine swiveling domain-containing protein